MRLHSWVIDGVGELPRVESGELPNALVVVYSPDAARKDAALGMIRRLLFASQGPPSPEAHCTARISGPNGDFELTTNGSPGSESLRHISGEAAGSDELARLFGHSERSGLRRVFDVGSGTDLDRMLDGYTQSAPLAHGQNSIARRMVEILGNDADGALDEVLVELAQTELRLQEAIEHEADFYDRMDAERRATAAIGQLCADLADLRRRRERFKAYIALWPAWLRRAQPEKELAALGEIDHFPDTEIGIVEAQQRAHEAGEQLQELRKRHRQARAELEVVPPAGDRHMVADRVDAICSELPAYRTRLTAFTRARARHDDLTAQRRELRHGTNANDGEQAFDPSTLDLTAAREWLLRAERSAQDEAKTRAELEHVRASLKQLRSDRQRAVRAVKTLDIELDDSDEHWRALWSLRDDLEQLWETQSQGESVARSAEKRLEALQSLDANQYRAATSKIGTLLWIVAAGSFVAALWSARRADSFLATVFSAVAVASVLADLGLGLQRRWAQNHNSAIGAKAQRLRHDLERARKLRDARWRAADEIAERVEYAATALGLASMPSLEDVDAAENKLFEASRKLHERGPLAETALAVHQLCEEEEDLMTELREIRHARDAAALEWEDWKDSVGLPAGLRQEDLTTYLCESDRWREIVEQLAAADSQLRELSPVIEAWETEARALLRDVGVQVRSQLCGRELEDQLTTLRDSAHRSLRLFRRRAELRDRLVPIEAELAEIEPKAQETQRLFDALRESAGTADEAEFERRRQIFRRRRELSESLRQHDEEFTRQLTEYRVVDDSQIRTDLATGNADLWLEQANHVDAEIERLEALMEATSHERAVAAADCRHIEETSEVAGWRQDCACLREEIRRLADEWRSLALANGLIEAAAQSVSQSAPLLNEASASLRKMTLGEMVRIALPADGECLVVVDRSGEQHLVNGSLPADLARRIELSLQLGMVRDFNRGVATFPVVMDEVLRGLDEEEAAAMAEEILRLASEQQVFYFTSDETSIRALRRAGDVPRVLQI